MSEFFVRDNGVLNIENLTINICDCDPVLDEDIAQLLVDEGLADVGPECGAHGCYVAEAAVAADPVESLEAFTMRRRRRDNTLIGALISAINQSDEIEPDDAFRLKLAIWLRPGVRQAIESRLIQQVAAVGGVMLSYDPEDPTVTPTFDLDDFERLLQILIEYLPQLIEIFIGLL